MRAVFLIEESVDCLSVLISAEFKELGVGVGRKTGSPGRLKPRVWNSEHPRNAGGRGEELACPGACCSPAFLCLASYRHPGLRKAGGHSGLSSVTSHAYRSIVLFLPLAATPQLRIPPAGPQWDAQDFLPLSPPSCGPQSPVLSGRRRGRECPFACAQLCCSHGHFWFPCFRYLKGKLSLRCSYRAGVGMKHSSDHIASQLKQWVRFDCRAQEASTSFSDLTSVCFVLNICCALAPVMYVYCVLTGPCFLSPAPLPSVSPVGPGLSWSPASPQLLSGSASFALCPRCFFLWDPFQARSGSSHPSLSHSPRLLPSLSGFNVILYL